MKKVWMWTGVVLLATIVIAGARLLLLMDAQFADQVKMLVRERITNDLTLIQERLQPEKLVEEGMFDVIVDCRQMNAETAQKCGQKLRACFGDQARWIAVDASGTRIAGQGFSSIEEECLSVFQLDYRLSEQGPLDPREALKLSRLPLINVFGKSHTPTRNMNRIYLRKVSLRGERGFLLMACLFSDDIPGRRLLRMQGPVKGIPQPAYFGGLAVFVPVAVAKNHFWTRKRIETIYARNIASASVAAGLPPGARGILEEEGQFTGFYRVETGTMTTLLVFPENLDQIRSGNVRLHMGLLLLGGVLALVGFAWIGRGGMWSGRSLLQKFVFMTLLVGLVPTTGLFWSWTTLDQWRASLDREERFRRLEERIAEHEQEFVILQSRLLTLINRFLFDVGRLSDGTRGPAFLALIEELDRQAISCSGERIGINLLRQGETKIFSSEATWYSDMLVENKERKNNTSQVVSLLLEGLRSSFALSESGRTGGMQAARGEIVVEALEGVLGRQQLYVSVARHDQLVGFQFWTERMWALIHILKDTLSSSRDLMFFNLRRKFIQRNMMIAWTARQFSPDGRSPPGMPEMVIGHCLDTDYYLSCEPLCRSPLVSRIVHRLARDGSAQRFSFAHEGVEYDALARQIKGMDLIGIAIERQTRRAWTWTDVFSLGVIAYPLLVGLLAGTLFRFFILKPLGTLKDGVERIQQGNLDACLPVLTDDEIGDVCCGFNRMAAGLREKELMSRFLSQLTLEAMEKAEQPPATRCRATVMFSDIRGFTTLSESRPGEEIVAMLNDYLTRMEEVIEAHGGIIDKFIGDAVMAIFLPIHGREDPAERAVRAGLAMRAALAVFNQERRTAGSFEIQTGIGIATGEVLMGALGGGARRDFTVTGPTVNRAACMEKCSKEATATFVVVCPETVGRIRSQAELVLVGNHASGAAEHPDSAWEVLRF